MKGRSGDCGPRPTVKKYTQKKPRHKGGGIHELSHFGRNLLMNQTLKDCHRVHETHDKYITRDVQVQALLG